MPRRVFEEIYRASVRDVDVVVRRYEHSREVSAVFLGFSGVVFSAVVSFVGVKFIGVANLWPLIVEGTALVLLSISFSVTSLLITQSWRSNLQGLLKAPKPLTLTAFWRLGRGVNEISRAATAVVVAGVAYYFELAMTTLAAGLVPILLIVPLTIDPPMWLVATLVTLTGAAYSIVLGLQVRTRRREVTSKRKEYDMLISDVDAMILDETTYAEAPTESAG